MPLSSSELHANASSGQVMLCPFRWIVVLSLPTFKPSVDGQIKLCCNDTFPFTVSPQFGPPLADATPPPKNAAVATTSARPNRYFVTLTSLLPFVNHIIVQQHHAKIRGRNPPHA